jgi:hypothetical protein
MSLAATAWNQVTLQIHAQALNSRYEAKKRQPLAVLWDSQHLIYCHDRTDTLFPFQALHVPNWKL